MRRLILAMWALLGTVPAANAAETAPSCAAAQSCPLVGPATPADRAQCLKWQTELERPARFVSGGQIQLDRFEKLVGDWMGAIAIV